MRVLLADTCLPGVSRHAGEGRGRPARMQVITLRVAWSLVAVACAHDPSGWSIHVVRSLSGFAGGAGRRGA
jgi:hypothetical protein